MTGFLQQLDGTYLVKELVERCEVKCHGGLCSTPCDPDLNVFGLWYSTMRAFCPLMETKWLEKANLENHPFSPKWCLLLCQGQSVLASLSAETMRRIFFNIHCETLTLLLEAEVTDVGELPMTGPSWRVGSQGILAQPPEIS